MILLDSHEMNIINVVMQFKCVLYTFEYVLFTLKQALIIFLVHLYAFVARNIITIIIVFNSIRNRNSALSVLFFQTGISYIACLRDSSSYKCPLDIMAAQLRAPLIALNTIVLVMYWEFQGALNQAHRCREDAKSDEQLQVKPLLFFQEFLIRKTCSRQVPSTAGQ